MNGLDLVWILMYLIYAIDHSLYLKDSKTIFWIFCYERPSMHIDAHMNKNA